MTIDVKIHIDLTPKQKKIVRWAVVSGAVIGALGIGVALAQTAPPTFTGGETLQASDLNAMSSAIGTLQIAVPPPGTIIAYGGTIDGNPGDVVGGGAPQHPPPSGWLLCNGDQLNGLNYAALYSAIGVNFGGSTTSQAFNLPDLRGQFLRGVDDGVGHDPDSAQRTAGAAGGNAGDLVGSSQADAFKFHAPSVTDLGHSHTDQGHSHPTQGYLINVGTSTNGNFSGGAIGYEVSSGTGMGYAVIETGYANIQVTGTGGNETRPENVSVNYIIKY